MMARALASIIFFLALEWFLAATGVWWLSWLPWPALSAVWWMGRLRSEPRFAYALCAGIILDAVSGRAFGAYVILFLLLAGITEALHAIFSAHDSRPARLVSRTLMFILFFSLLPAVSALVS